MLALTVFLRGMRCQKECVVRAVGSCIIPLDSENVTITWKNNYGLESGFKVIENYSNILSIMLYLTT